MHITTEAEDYIDVNSVDKFSYESDFLSGPVHNVLITESSASFAFCSCKLAL